MSSTPSRPVRRRQVFYIPGYDPFPARRYRELYRKEAALQAAISGYEIAVRGDPSPRDGFGWHVDACIAGQSVQTEIDVLIWSDLVRESFNGSVLNTYAALVRTAALYISTGALMRLMRLRKGPVIAALYPVLMLLGQLTFACAVGAFLFLWLQKASTRPTDGAFSLAFLTLSAAVSLATIWAILRFFKAQDSRVFAHYLMHDFSYSSAGAGAYAHALDQRLGEFRAKVARALASPVDEVLIVGHSSGVHLGVSLLADLVRHGDVERRAGRLAFLSLGHVVPMVSFLPKATRLRSDLRLLSTTPEVTWVDVTAPGDGCCFALCDPVSVSGQDTAEKRGPLVFSAAFTLSLSAARWRKLRWRFFRLHLQYLCAFDRPKDYDYFQITAGPVCLADRFEGRPASKSRIERSATGYTSVAP